MKKSLIALAILAASGAALAQSNVSLYGRVDASVGSTKLNGVSNSQMYSGNLSTSRWGVRGTEDLGGGLKANFNLETAINVVDGSSTGFNRQSWVGLSGGFGALRLGKSDSVFKDVYDLGNTHNVFDSEFTATKEAYRAGLGGFTSRPNNQIRYDSPNLSGFSGALGYAYDQTAGTKTDISALNLRYAGGPLSVGLGYQTQANPAAASDLDFTVLAGTYNFGVARVSAQYQITKNAANSKDKEFAVGVSVPLGAFEVSVGYADSEAENAAGATVQEGQAFSIGATYALSKRTRLYAGYIDGEVETAAGAPVRDARMYAMGVRHDF